MAHELRGSPGQCANQLHQTAGVEAPGNLEAREMIREAAAALPQHGLKSYANHSKGAADGALLPSDSARLHRKIEGPPHPGNSILLRDSCHGVQHWRQQMRVLVRIQVRRFETRIQN